MSFAVAQGIDYHRLGYSDSQVAALPGMLATLHLDHDEQEHLFFKLRQKGYDVQGKKHDHVEMMHFDSYGTHVNDIPGVFRRATLWYPFERNVRGCVHGSAPSMETV